MTDLAGRLAVRPGGALPTIRSTRREWASAIGRGRPARALPDLLGAVFTLCGGAHRVAAGLAIAAAQQGRAEVTPALRTGLRIDTLREHLRRLWLDLPALLHDRPAADLAALASCPLLQHSNVSDEGRRWVEAQVLGLPVADWLAAWQADPGGWAEQWAATAGTGPAHTLAALRPALRGLSQRVVSLQAQGSALELQRLADPLRQEPGFALAPTWRGHTAETGCWTRSADSTLHGADNPAADPWLRLASRVADVARLVAPQGDLWLAQGALALDEHEGLGWCEMARGLLIHWVRLDAQGQVADCRLIAPTEWNFHPYGSAARALAALPADAPDLVVRALVAAYDPCVVVDLDRATEQAHA